MISSSIVRLVDRVLSALIAVVRAVAWVTVVLMMVHVVVDVVARYLFGTTPPATIVIVSQYYMLLLVFVALFIPELRNEHVTVEVATQWLPAHVQHHLYSWTYLFSAAVFGILAWGTWDSAMLAYKTGSFIIERGTKLPVWPTYFALPLGCGLMTLTLLHRFFAYLTRQHSRLFDPVVNLDPGAAGREG